MTTTDSDRAAGGPSNLLDAPPVDTRYVWGLWHRDRATAWGAILEARVALRAAVTRGPGARRRFLVVGRARSGTTLLRSLLDAHPSVTCEGEVLHRVVLRPARHLKNLARKARTEAWGAKLLSYQMVQVHRLRDPAAFLGGLHARGFVLIHLERDTFAQCLSLLAAQGSGRYHDRAGGAGGAPRTGLLVDPADFAARLRWSAMLLRYERAALRDLPHVRVSYDDDLADPRAAGPTMARLFEAIGVPARPVRSDLRKILPAAPRDAVENYDAVARAVSETGLGHLLPG